VCGENCVLTPVCSDCNLKFFSINKESERCKYCGRTLISTSGTCLECRENPVLTNVDFAFPLYSYRLWNKELLFEWKMKNVRSLSYFFAKKAAEAMEFLDVKVIVPVPPRKGKIAKNGWDQVDELCSILESCFGFKVLRILERTSEVQQKKLDRNERLQTIESAYRLLPEKKISKMLKKFDGCLPETVCLIDDVCTTGSTLECCSKLLRTYGFKRVGVLSLFTVD